MKTLQEINNLQTNYSNFKKKHWIIPTKRTKDQTIHKCCATPPSPKRAQDYQHAMQFVQDATNRIDQIESEEMIPSMIDCLLCRINHFTSPSNNNNHQTNNNMQGVDVALACQMLHGQNAKYLLHLETILMQYGYISPSQREEEENDQQWNEGLDQRQSYDHSDDGPQTTTPNTRRSSILLDSFHNNTQDREEDSIQDGFVSFMLDNALGEPLNRLSEEQDDDDYDNDEWRKHTLASQQQNKNDFQQDTLQDIMVSNHVFHSSSSSMGNTSLQLEDSMGNDTGELMISFDDVSTVDPIIDNQNKRQDDDGSNTDEDDEEDEDEEESLDPTIVCNRKILEELVLGTEVEHDSDGDANVQKITSPLDKYQVQILSSGTICRVSPIANDVLKGSIQSPILKNSHPQLSQENEKVQVKTPTQLNVSVQNHETFESDASKEVKYDDDDTDSEKFDSFHCSEDVQDAPLLSESGLTFRKLNQTRFAESSFESSLEEGVDNRVADEGEEGRSSSDDETLIRMRASSSDSSFEPSTNQDDVLDDYDGDDYESDFSKSSTRPHDASSRSFHISQNRENTDSSEEGYGNTAPSSSTSHASSAQDEIDNASVATFESCFSQQGQDTSHATLSVGATPNNKESCRSTPVAESISVDHRTPINSSQKVHVRTPLAAAWIEKYMPDQKEKLLGQLSVEKAQLIHTPSLTKITGSANGCVGASFASPPIPNDTNQGIINLLSEREYEEAPRVIKMQVSVSELNHTIQIINKWLSNQKGTIQGISLQEEMAYEILKDSFEKPKSKSLLMSLVHFRRLVMQLSSLAGGGGKRFVISQK